MPAVKKSLKLKREIIAKVKPKKKCPSTIGEGNTERGNARKPLSCGGRKKNVHMHEYRRKRLKALRQKCWEKAATNCSNTIYR